MPFNADTAHNINVFKFNFKSNRPTFNKIAPTRIKIAPINEKKKLI
jgi:hypothetical protein